MMQEDPVALAAQAFAEDTDWSALLQSHPGQCGEFFRYAAEERTGPRGGRQTWAFAKCVQCGHETERVRTPRPGSLNGVETRLLFKLREMKCAKPYVEDPHAELLRDIAKLVEDGERLPFRHAVKYLADGRSLADVLTEAWTRTTDGHAMGVLLRAMQSTGKHRNGFAYSTVEKDGRVRVAFDAPQLHVSLSGSRSEVAYALALLVDRTQIEAIAARIERGGP
jgi:hypothetical protein